MTNENRITRRIIIENFGALQHVDICFDKQLMVVIGPQASGKSTFGKAVYFCRKIRDYLCDYAHEIWRDSPQSESYINFLKYLRNPFIGYFGTTKHMDLFKIQYYYNVSENKYIIITLDESHFAKFKFSSNLEKEIKGLITEAVEVSADRGNSFTDAVIKQTTFFSQFTQSSYQIFQDSDSLLYIPAGRNLLATIPDLIIPDTGVGIQSNSHIDITQIDLITQEFIQYIQQMRKRFGSRLEEITENYVKTVKGQIRNHDVKLACELIKDILKAEYVYDRDGEKLYYSKNKWVKLMFGSSGQQEVLWALNCIFLSILQNERTFLIFEEPEAHIFPDAQETLSRLIALLINSTGSSVLATTHSPYMLTTFNLLIFSSQVEEKDGTVVNRQCRLNKELVSAYLISADDGQFYDIVNNDRGLIDALEIDHVSDRINEKMDILLSEQIRNTKEDFI